jgi:hypothetical protein
MNRHAHTSFTLYIVCMVAHIMHVYFELFFILIMTEDNLEPYRWVLWDIFFILIDVCVQILKLFYDIFNISKVNIL